MPHSARCSVFSFALLAGLSSPSQAAQWLEPAARTIVRGSAPAGTSELFGWRVRAMGDVDGDGVVDFAVSAPFFQLNIGRVSMRSGADGSELWSRNANVQQQSHILGFALERGADMDGDGVDEVFASAPFWNSGPGFVHVFSGATGATLQTLSGAATLDRFGYSVATRGDFDGDGVDDVAVAASVRRRVYVFSGPGFAPLTTIDPIAAEGVWGSGLAFVRDTDGDGRDELAIAARLGTGVLQTAGRLYVIGFDGTTTAVRLQIDNVDLGLPLDGDNLASGGDVDADGTDDLFLGEGDQDRARVFSGRTGATLHTFADPGVGFSSRGIIPDVNGDGFDDVLVGARRSAAGATNAGQMRLYSGRDGRRLWTVSSTQNRASFGADVDLIGDLDGDGGLDFVVGAMSENAAYVVAGPLCWAGFRDYGSAHAGGGTPTLGMSDDPAWGALTHFEIDSGQAATAAAALVLGTAAASVPLPGGATALVQPAWSVPLMVPAAGTRLAVRAPATGCAVLFGQAFFVDAGASGGLAHSAGLRLSTGR